MKKFFAFIKKECYHIFRDYRTLLILFGMPIIQILLFGFAITNELNFAKIAVFDKSKDEFSQKFIQKIISSKYFKLSAYLNSDKEIKNIFKSSHTKEIIIIEKNFSKNLKSINKSKIQLILDASDPNMANMVLNYTTNIMNNFLNEIQKSNKIKSIITPEIRMRYNPDLKSAYMFVPGLMAVILLLISALMTSISITKEKELGTMEILLVSPLKPTQIIIGKVLPYIILSFSNALTILIFAKYVFYVPITGSLFLLLSESLLFIITSLSLGIMVSSVTSSQKTAMMISLVALMMPTMLLSGYIFPIKNMPEWLQILTNIIPAKWFIKIVRGIMLKGSSYKFILKETLILISMSLFFIFISIKKFKTRLE